MPSSRTERTDLRAHIHRLVALLAWLLAGGAPTISETRAETPAGRRSTPEPSVATRLDAEEKRLATEGMRHFQAGAYEKAIESFEAAYRRVPSPLLIYNIAQAHRLNGKCPQAVQHYRKFLGMGPVGKERERALRFASELAACTDEGPSFATATGEQATTPPEAEPPPPPTPPAATLAAPALPLAPPRVTLDARPHPEHATNIVHPRHTEVTPTRNHSGLILGLGTATLVSGSTSAYFGWRAHRAGTSTSRVFANAEPWSESAASTEADGRRSQTIAIATGVAALITAGVALWLFLRD
jgi:hypothetical protein